MHGRRGGGLDLEVHRALDPTFNVNIYVVKGEDVAVVDTGTGRDPDATLRRLEALPEGCREVSHILLTHRHIDHVGGARHIARRYNAPIAASVDDGPCLLEGDEITTVARLFRIPLEPMDVHLLPYGARIDLGDATLEVIHTPGHTVGSVCYYDRATGSLFTGDTLFAYGGVGRWDVPTGDFQSIVRSIKAVEGLRPANLYPGHGPVVMGEAMEHVHMALEQLEVLPPEPH